MKYRAGLSKGRPSPGRPSQEGRGLKLRNLNGNARQTGRSSQEGRGLKYGCYWDKTKLNGSSLARGTWIEIVPAGYICFTVKVVPRKRDVD